MAERYTIIRAGERLLDAVPSSQIAVGSPIVGDMNHLDYSARFKKGEVLPVKYIAPQPNERAILERDSTRKELVAVLKQLQNEQDPGKIKTASLAQRKLDARIGSLDRLINPPDPRPRDLFIAYHTGTFDGPIGNMRKRFYEFLERFNEGQITGFYAVERDMPRLQSRFENGELRNCRDQVVDRAPGWAEWLADQLGGAPVRDIEIVRVGIVNVKNDDLAYGINIRF